VSNRLHRYARWAMIALICLSVPNLFVLYGISAWLGGDAWYGKIEAGRYFVGSKGRLAEVTEQKYYLILYQIYSVIIGYAGLFVAMVFAQVLRLISWARARLSTPNP
jgi:hypothetical protein